MKKTSYTRELITSEPNLDIGFAEVNTDMVRLYTPFHWLNSYELIYIISGSAIFQKMSYSTCLCAAVDFISTEPYEIHDIVAQTFKEKGYSLRFQSLLFELLFQPALSRLIGIFRSYLRVEISCLAFDMKIQCYSELFLFLISSS